ncbi:Protein N-acetyltransferase, RimJ/RimL family [Loktanella sp. DSM 29012]|uniref:GNAT family N-acetyltransferase n=1 Tax=unclassified Loktanella TaxID=290910 RepID=UPI0007011CB9|nr:MULTISPECIES: GNAT family N-acetyltransferase [unclassified Loktanella]SEQ40847.1 Protein N-acetyltransferase, RimJ/RimL family [Loktanella sp. DSM 29012]
MNHSLQTARLILRQPNASDWPAFRDFMASDRGALFGHTTEGAAWRSFAAELGHWQIFGYGMWAVTQRGSDAIVALIGPWCPPDWPEREIGWMVLDPAIEGTGIAHEAAKASLMHAFTALGWTTAVSYIAPGNTRSAALAARLGAAPDHAATPPASYAGQVVWRHPLPKDLS